MRSSAQNEQLNPDCRYAQGSWRVFCLPSQGGESTIAGLYCIEVLPDVCR